MSLKKLWSEYGIGAILGLIILAYGISLLLNYLSSKGRSGSEKMVGGMNTAYGNGGFNGNSMGVQPAEAHGNEVFSSVKGMQTSMPDIPSSCSKPNIQNPEELLPKGGDGNQWAQLNPSGKGDLANINLLKAGYHIGIDTIGQTLRNGNLQIRSEPPNPQLYVGPWNQSTIEPDFMRPPLEIGAGSQ